MNLLDRRLHRAEKRKLKRITGCFDGNSHQRRIKVRKQQRWIASLPKATQ